MTINQEDEKLELPRPDYPPSSLPSPLFTFVPGHRGEQGA